MSKQDFIKYIEKAMIALSIIFVIFGGGEGNEILQGFAL